MTKYRVSIFRKLRSWVNGTLTKETAVVFPNLSFEEAKEKCEYIAYFIDGNTNPELVGYEAHIEAEGK